MQSQGNIRVVEMLRYLYQHTDENHPATALKAGTPVKVTT